MALQFKPADFESEVRRVARAKWPSAVDPGSAVIGAREHDGLFQTEEAIHYVEATISNSAEKAREDTKKIFRRISEKTGQNPLLAVKGWLITRVDPTADQRETVRKEGKGQVAILSFAQFQQSLIDVRAYLAARGDHAFGSVQDIKTGDRRPSAPYIEQRLRRSDSGEQSTLASVEAGLVSGHHYVILGDYGAGKSMCLRELFFRLEAAYCDGRLAKFPVYINLREHFGQSDPVEILERHARNIGFGPESSLVRAWRAGYVLMLIDGFDEVTALGAQGVWKKLGQIRKRSLEGVRQLIRGCAGIGVLVAGRNQYFTSHDELRSCMGLDPQIPIFEIEEFDDAGITKFVASISGSQQQIKLPSWLPTRPLLLGCLAARGQLGGIGDENESIDSVDGWDYLLTRIFEREERIEANLDGATLRRILERLATVARTTQLGLGPISTASLFDAFREICQYEPDQQAILLIQRLPGLGTYSAQDESRSFVDKELADICCGSEAFRFISNPYEFSESSLWQESMRVSDRVIGASGARFVSRKMKTEGHSDGHLRGAAQFLESKGDFRCARGDIARVSMESGFTLNAPFEVRGLSFESGALEIDCEQCDLSSLVLSECYIEEVELGSSADATKLPHLQGCLIDRISGRMSRADLPKILLDSSTDVGQISSSAATNNAILDAKLTAGERVAIVCLRKLYFQGLSGRQPRALHRGLDMNERRLVDDVLSLLRRHDLAREYRRSDSVVVLPIKKALDRVRRIVLTPVESGDPLLRDARALE